MQHNVSTISRTVPATTLEHIIRARVKHFNEDFFKMIWTLILWCLSVQGVMCYGFLIVIAGAGVSR
jgi:hypothetical protein